MRTWPPFPSGTRMISWDIKNFYPNCETSMCLEAIKKVLDKYEPKMSILRKACICEAVQITMTSNNCSKTGRFLTQINGATIGGPDSASITDIFGGQFIDPVAERGIRTNAGEVLEPTDWRRYRDDTWNIEACELAKPGNILRFTGHLNENICKGKIIFEPDNDPKELTFLDTKVYLEDGYLKPVIYSKSTDAHRYLDPASCHPRKVTGAIPLSVGLRV